MNMIEHYKLTKKQIDNHFKIHLNYNFIIKILILNVNEMQWNFTRQHHLIIIMLLVVIIRKKEHKKYVVVVLIERFGLAFAYNNV